MSAVLEQPKTELTLVQRAAVALGTQEHELRLRELVKQSAGIIEVKNGAGRDECHAAYMRLKNSRISVEKASKSATEDAKAFSKAVTAEERRLIAITQAEEDRLQALRDAWDAEVEAEKARKIAAERARVEAIQTRITEIRDFPLLVVGASSDDISSMIGSLASMTIGELFEEFQDEAKAARLESLDKMAKAETAVRALETEAEAKRQQAAREKAEREEEAARLKAEREQLDRERAEQAAHAAEQQRIANEEAAKVAAQAKAEREAAQAELKTAQDKFNREQAAAREETARKAAEAQRVIDEANRVQREAEDRRIAEIHAAEESEVAQGSTATVHGIDDLQRAAELPSISQSASDLPQIAADMGDQELAQTFAYSFDGERYYGEEPTILDALQEALADNDEATQIYVGKCMHFVGRIDAEDIIERLQEQCWEECDEFGESYLKGVTTEEKAELESLVNAWAARVDRSNFFIVKDAKCYAVEEARALVAAGEMVAA